MNSTKLFAGLAACALTVSAPIAAAGDTYSTHGSGDTGFANVIHVEPITRSVRVSTPRRECWDEQVTRYHHSGSRYADTYTPHILGGILGGLAGNQFGSGRGNAVMTAAGALLGGSIGRDMAHQRRGRYHSYPATETRCHVTHDTHYEEVADGYRVEYEYGGKTYVTQMRRHPGDRIRVRVNVTPVY